MTASPDGEAPRDGFVFAATGDLYNDLARRAARNLRAAMPRHPVDLFTDREVTDPVFDRVHRLDRVTRRPKMEALRRSRFARTVYLDCDVIAGCDSSDMFELLGRFDFLGVHDNFRNGPNQRFTVRDKVPAGFASINSGVIGIRAGPKVTRLLQAWEDEMRRLNARWDQPLLREILYASDLRIHILPYDYNLMYMPLLGIATRGHLAPRFLHVPKLHDAPVDRDMLDQPFALADILPPHPHANYGKLLTTDRSVGGIAPFDEVWPRRRPPSATVRQRIARGLSRRLRGAARRLGLATDPRV